MRARNGVAALLRRAGADAWLERYWGLDRLTVLAYHRIALLDDTFAWDRGNVSASPRMFEAQMRYVAQHFNAIDLAALHAFMCNGTPLPPRPLLVTFDDGYLDSYTDAFPVLREYGLPGVMFLVTDYLDRPAHPWSGLSAYLFHHSRKEAAHLPLLGGCDLSTAGRRAMVMQEWKYRVNPLPPPQRNDLVAALALALDVTPPEEPPPFLSWTQVRELVAGGVSCQPHSVTHPMLTHVDAAVAREEVVRSRQRVEEETGQSATTFAYPNGDYDAETVHILAAAGYELAFTMAPGPARLVEAREQPLEIARVYVGYRDSLDTFALKTLGLPRLARRRLGAASYPPTRS
jgi:peptidoglycan/xylan/chitin deacetylase (PgdA/CDA1 family)